MASCSISDLLNDRKEFNPTKNSTFNSESSQVALKFAVINLNCALGFRIIGSSPDHADRGAAILDKVIKIALKFSTVVTIDSGRRAIVGEPFSYTTCHFIRSFVY
jgi:hypothetical protein